METAIANPFKGKVEDALWKELVEKDPASAVSFSAMSPWQGSSVVFGSSPLAEVRPADSEAKGNTGSWRDLQVKCWELYRSFGPINATVNSKADSVAGSGFGAYSDNLQIQAFLNELIFGHHNRLDMRVVGWMIRMLAEVETFLLLSIEMPPKVKSGRKSPLVSDKPRVTIRVLEPSRIGVGSLSGLIKHPDDPTQTLFYEYVTNAGGTEIIPDINIAYNPELETLVADKVGKGTQTSLGKGPEFKELKYRRWVIHWKNLSGLMEYERDTSGLSTVLEFANLYQNAVKWDLDFKKAQSSYAIVIKFEDTPAGKVMSRLWNAMTPTEKEATGLTKPIKPGERVFLPYGMDMEIKSPNIKSISGNNQDLIDIVGSGARSPMDLFQGQVAGMSYSQVKASRSPLEMETDNLQYKFGNFFKYNLLRACFFLESVFNSFPDTFQKTEISELVNGVPKEEVVNVEPIELVNMVFPLIKYESEPLSKVQAFLGTQNGGMAQIGMSEEDMFKSMGVRDYSRQKRKRILEEQQYGKPVPYNESQVQKDLKAPESVKAPLPEEKKASGEDVQKMVDVADDSFSLL